VDLLRCGRATPITDAANGPVMVFDKTCTVQNDPDRELRKVVAEAMG
jgi:hypothetical protein